jgi:hypothetical protein
MTVSDLSTSLAHTVEFYLIAAAEAGEGAGFDANGDPVIQDAYSLVESVGPTTDASVESGWIGSLTQPNWCDEPIDETGYMLGYSSDSQVIVRWDVEGGFAYR